MDADALARLDAACDPPDRNRALKAFYGARDEGPRAQEVFTPLSLVAPLLSVWGGITLDPCAHPNSPVSAIAGEAWCGEAVEWKTNKKGEQVPVKWRGRGLTDRWRDRTYANPPFSELEVWVDRFRSEAGRIALLSPNRTQRRWLRAAMRESVVVALDTVTFEGFDQGFPQGLFLLVKGDGDLAVAHAYERSGLGELICSPRR